MKSELFYLNQLIAMGIELRSALMRTATKYNCNVAMLRAEYMDANVNKKAGLL